MVLDDLEVHSYKFGNFHLIPEEHLLLRDGESVALPPKVFDALVVLVKNEGHLIEKSDLLDRLWADAFVEEATLARTISSLRKALGESAENKFIETVPKRGYRFIAPVQPITEDEILSSTFLLDYPESTRDASKTTAVEDEIEPIFEPDISAPPLLPHRRLSGRQILLIIGLIASALIIGFMISRNWQINPVKEVKTIAVLPFQQITDGERDEMLEFGMTDTLITRLSNVKQIIVRPTSAVSKYAGQKPDAVEVGRELKVDAVLEGSIQRSGERVRVTVQLISADDGSSLWAEKFDKHFTDIFALQDSIAGQVVSALTLELSGKERELMTKHSTENTEAYRLYIMGRYFWNKRSSVESLKKSIDYYEQAIAKDPNYALAYTGLADCYQLLAEYLATTPKEGFTKARKAAEKALEIDDQLAEAHTSLAYTLAFYDWDFAGAEKEFKRALELDPNYPTAHQWYGEFLIAMGRFDEAKTAHEKALQIDPTSLVFHTEMAGYFYVTRQFDKAITQAQTVIEMEPDYAFSYVFLSFSYGQKGMKREAAEAYIKSVELFGEAEEAKQLQKALAENSVKAMWLKRLEQVDSPARKDSFPAQWRALIYIWLGNKEKALDWLEIAYERRDRWMINIKYSPEFDSLRSEPRFQVLIRRIGL